MDILYCVLVMIYLYYYIPDMTGLRHLYIIMYFYYDRENGVYDGIGSAIRIAMISIIKLMIMLMVAIAILVMTIMITAMPII